MSESMIPNELHERSLRPFDHDAAYRESEHRVAALEAEVARLDSAVRSLTAEKTDLQALLAQQLKEVQALQFALSKRPLVKPERPALVVATRPENKRPPVPAAPSCSRFPAPSPGFDPRAVPPWIA